MQLDISYAGRVWLAPMAGYTDVSFRAIARSFGWKGLCFTEMLNPQSILMFFKKAHKKQKGKVAALLESSQADTPIAYQLYGNKPQEILDAALLLGEKYNAKWIDINMGCPQRKISARGAGAGLLLNPKLALEMVSLLKEKTNFFISAKLRIGWDENDRSGLKLACELAKIGVSAIIIHARTKEQGYSGKANLNLIKEAVEKLPTNVFIVGNGDIVSVATGLTMLEKTGCNAVMIGRAALKEPWLLRDLELTLLGKEPPAPPSKKERIAIMLKHFDDFIRRFEEDKAHRIFRRWIPCYAKTVGYDKHTMLKLLNATSTKELKSQLLELQEKLLNS